jgi:hypothetical protein
VSDHEAQEQSGGDTEDILCWVELPLELSQIGEGFGEVGDELVFLCGHDDHIVYISFDVLPNWDFKNFWIAFWYVALVFFRPKVMTL